MRRQALVMFNMTQMVIVFCVLLVSLGLVGAGVGYWLYTRKKAIRREGTPNNDAPAIAASSITARAGSIGAVSQEVRYDVRDLMMMGFSHVEILYFSREEIMSVVNGERTLQQLRDEKTTPANEIPPPRARAKPVREASPLQARPTLSEKQIKELVQGLWANEDPNEGDFRDAIRFAGQYRKECETKLRQLGKEAIPYLEPYADRKEVAPLLEELNRLS